MKGANSSSSRDTEEFLGTASKYFQELERYLTESLAFTAWALLHDHSQDPNPFQFGLEADHARGMSLVQAAFEESDERTQTFDYLSEKLTIYTLVRGFGFLAKYLEAMKERGEGYKREKNQVPPYARGSRLKQFPFMHTAPFLDLTEKSKTGIINQLGEASRSLLRGKVNDVRNSLQHYRKSQDGVTQILGALEEIEITMRGLEMSGFGVVEYRVEDTVHDRWGRSEYYFEGPRSNRHVVTRPSAYDWLGMPPLPSPQYVVSKALFAEPNEALRFSRRTDSSYTAMWTNYPNRRRARASALSQDRVERTGNEVNSR